MSSNVRSWLVWLLPFLVSGGMAFGALIGMAIAWDDARQEGPAGDMAGAAGALAVVICIVAGFVMATITMIVAKVLRRAPPNRLVLRLGLAIVGGGIIGVLVGLGEKGVPGIDVLLICGVPILLSWSWRAKTAPGGEAPSE